MENQESQAVVPAEGMTGWLKNPLIKKTAIVLVVAAVLGGGYYYSLQKKTGAGKKEEAKAKVVAIIGEDNPRVKVKDVAEESGLYKVSLGVEGQPDQYVYVTKDLKKFIEQATEFTFIEEQIAKQKQEEEEANKPLNKSDRPVVDLYVMSLCPFGNKAEDTLKPVYDLLKKKVDFNFRYIVNVEGEDVGSLHGKIEADLNKREACVMKLFGKDKWMSFVGYTNKNCGTGGQGGSCWEAGARSLGINVQQVNGCVETDGIALMKADAEATDSAGVTGSPTMFINGKKTNSVSQFGNPESYKKAICEAFNTAPDECSKVLAAQPGAGQSASQAASCN